MDRGVSSRGVRTGVNRGIPFFVPLFTPGTPRPQARPLKKVMVKPVLARYVGPPGQDPRELIDVYRPPVDEHAGFAIRDDMLDPIKRKSRKMVHRDGDWHRSVHAWLVHPPSRSVVIQKRTEWKDTNPNMWDVSAAGHITSGDSSELTVFKELEEELGFDADGCNIVYLFTSISEHSSKDTKCNLFQDVYIVEVLKDPDEIEFCSLGQCEVADVKFVPFEHLKTAYDSGDENFVIRPTTYSEKLFKILGERYGRCEE